MEQSLFSMALDGSINNNTFLNELDKNSNMNSSGMSVSQERTPKHNPLLQSQSNKKKVSASTARKRTYEPSNMGSTNRNSFYDTYHKIQTLTKTFKPSPNQKPSLRNFPMLNVSPLNQSGSGFNSGRDSKMNESKTVGFKINSSINEPSTCNPNSPKLTSPLGGRSIPSNFKIKARANFKL